MEAQNEWYDMLDSVLFACRVSQHKSTGFSPFQMLYSKDPILPFEYADQSDNFEPESKLLGGKSANFSGEQSESDMDPITNILNRMESQRRYVFQDTEKKHKKGSS